VFRKFDIAISMAFLVVGNAGMALAQGGVTLTRDNAIGAKYGAPGPRSCSTTSLPRSGAISPAQARAYVICGYEKDYQGGSRSLYLIGHVQVQVGNGRPYEHVRDSLQDIDPHKQVFDIRGSSVKYSCAWPEDTVLPKARQCSRTVEKTDEGKCYQTTFHDWRCTWSDFYAPMSNDPRLNIPAPSASDVE
jgi:hypothetical protein